MSKRLFDQKELDALCKSGLVRVGEAIDRGDPDLATETVATVIALYRRFHQVYHGWSVSLSAFAAERFGHEAAAEIMSLDAVLARSARSGFSLDDIALLDEDPVSAVRDLLEGGDAPAAKALFSRVDSGARGLHDFYRDAVTTELSRVYRRGGVETLEACFRASSELDWMPWMMAETQDPPRDRLIAWADLLSVGNFGVLAIQEEDDKFVIRQDPCGSCGRQVREGRYKAPWNLAIVEDDHATTYGQGGVPIYRTHIPMMHYVMPVERIGAPWPLIRCSRKKEGVCRIHLYKDPKQKVPADAAAWLA